MKKIIFLLAFIFFAVQLCLAQIPKTISYQGILKNADGTSVTDGTYSITFKLYDISTEGTPLWTEKQSLTVNAGIFNHILGSINPLEIPFDKQYWLGIIIGDGIELKPRMKLASSAYSLNAASVADNSVTGSKIADGNVVRSINSLTENVTLAGGDNITISQSENTLTISSEGTSGLALPFSGNTSSSENAFSVTATGTGTAGSFSISNIDNDANVLSVGTDGKGTALYSENTGTTGSAGIFYTLNEINSNATFYAASFGGGSALNAYNHGTGVGGWFQINNSDNTKDSLVSFNKGQGWAGYFYGYTKGVYITAPKGQPGLHVANGTKSAVVATSQGARALYTEESTEVWFSDYGFGSLDNGYASIDIDPLFAETVNLEEPYHVFIQSYGNAELYVSKRNPVSFEVKLRDGEPGVEFSYRVVAKRKDYEQTRLEHASMADDDPNLYPEKRAAWEARKIVIEGH